MSIYEIFAKRFNITSNTHGLKQQINGADGDKNIEINKDRFESILLKRGVSSQVIETIFTTIDQNGDGKINVNDIQRVLQMYSQRNQTPDISEINSVKVSNIAVVNTSYFRNNHYPENPQKILATVEHLIGVLKEKAATYNNNGTPRISALGTFVNARV